MDNGRVNGRDRPVLSAVLGLGLGMALLVAVASTAAPSVSFVNNLLRQQRFSAGYRQKKRCAITPFVDPRFRTDPRRRRLPG